MMGVGAKRALGLYRSCAPRQYDDAYQADNTGHPAYDVSPDGARFLMIVNDESVRLDLVLNWTEELKKLVPVP